MAPISPYINIGKSANTLAMPLWFVVLAALLLGLRVYVKLPDSSHSPKGSINWITPAEFNTRSQSQYQGKGLVLYEFTADWCPPCKKRELTIFRTPAIIHDINDNFVPVKVDMTTDVDCQKAEIKNLIDKFAVNTVPRSVITLTSGELVQDGKFLYGNMEFDDMLDNAKQEAKTVHACLAVEQNDFKKALSYLNNDQITGSAIKRTDDYNVYIMVQHIFCMLNQQEEAKQLSQNTQKLTAASKLSETYIKALLEHLTNIDDFNAGKISEEKLLEHDQTNGEKAPDYLAIGLKNLRDGARVRALKAFNQSSMCNAKSFQTDHLADFLIKRLDQ